METSPPRTGHSVQEGAAQERPGPAHGLYPMPLHSTWGWLVGPASHTGQDRVSQPRVLRPPAAPGLLSI
eukprot:323402-Pyramimonas_sp.AAC.1